MLRDWCSQAPSSNIYPRAKEVKRIGSPSATRPGAMWSDCQVGFTNGWQMAEKQRGRRFRCGRGVGCRGCLHGDGLGLHFVDCEEAKRRERPSGGSGRVLRPLDLLRHSAARAHGLPQGGVQGLGQEAEGPRLVPRSETETSYEPPAGLSSRLSPRLKDRLEGQKGPGGRPGGHSRGLKVVHVVSPRSGFRWQGLGTVLATDEHRWQRARGQGPRVRGQQRPHQRVTRNTKSGHSSRSGGPPPVRPS